MRPAGPQGHPNTLGETGVALPESSPLPPLDADISPTNLVLGGTDGEAFAFLSLRPRDASSPVCSLNTCSSSSNSGPGQVGPGGSDRSQGSPDPRLTTWKFTTEGQVPPVTWGRRGPRHHLQQGALSLVRIWSMGDAPKWALRRGPGPGFEREDDGEAQGGGADERGLVPSFRALFVQRELPAFWPMLLCCNMSGSGGRYCPPRGAGSSTPPPPPPGWSPGRTGQGGPRKGTATTLHPRGRRAGPGSRAL